MRNRLALAARCWRLEAKNRTLAQQRDDAERRTGTLEDRVLAAEHIIRGLQNDLATADERAGRAERALQEALTPRPAAAQPVLQVAAGNWSGRVTLYEAAGIVSRDPASVPAARIIPMQQRGAVA